MLLEKKFGLLAEPRSLLLLAITDMMLYFRLATCFFNIMVAYYIQILSAIVLPS